jgi:hypothetical protein
MEFNQTNKTTEVVNSIATKAEERVNLSSASISNTEVLSNSLKVEVKDLNKDTLRITHDVRDLTSNFDKDNIKTSLVNVYGASGRLFASSRNLESVDVPKSEYPLRLDYSFILQNDKGIESTYNATYNIPNTDSSVLLSPTGSSTSSVNSVTIPEAVVKIDEDLAKIKNNLQNFSFIYDNSQKKTVPLHSLVLNMVSSIENITKELADVKEKIKDL